VASLPQGKTFTTMNMCPENDLPAGKLLKANFLLH